MREIKFRGWDHDNEQWVYGWLTVLVEGIRRFLAIINEPNGELTRYYIHDEESIGQYTGLKDKNGVEIYEGDILDFDEGEWGGKFTPEAVDMAKIIGEWQLCGSLADLREFRSVIGNIHQNPELLERDNG